MSEDWEEGFGDCSDMYDTSIGSGYEELDGIDAISMSMDMGMGMGMAFALAEEISKTNQNTWSDADYWDRDIKEDDYDIDEDTDRQNLEQVKRLSLSSRFETRKLRPFEQYVDDILKGRRPLFEDEEP